MQIAQQPYRILEQPAAVRVQRDARLRKALVQSPDGFHLVLAAQHATLELEVIETVARVRGLGLAHDGLRCQRLFMAHPAPAISLFRLILRGQVRQVGLRAVAHEEQVAQHLHRLALLPLAQEGRHRHPQVLAQQVQQGRLQCSTGVDGGAQVKGLLPATAGVPVCKVLAHAAQHRLPAPEGLADHQRRSVVQGLLDFLSAGYLANAGAALAVGEDEQVAGEERGVRA